MSISHKAFAFDWNAFDVGLAPILRKALDDDDAAGLVEFIEQERSRFTDPYNGDALPEDWRRRMEVGDVQELADFALTRYYRVGEDRGVGSAWLSVTKTLTAEQSVALLGTPFGMLERLFDPGRLGSYFQSPLMVMRSLMSLDDIAGEEVQQFRELLAECAARQFGVYVTF